MNHWKPLEIFLLYGFAAAILAVFATTVILLVLPKRKLAVWRVVFCCLSLAIAGCVAYGYFVEPYKLEISKIEIKTPKLHANSFRVVQVSDIHSDEVARLEPRLNKAVADLHPDVILFTGDAVNSPAGLPIFKPVLKGFADTAPTYVAKGDWDFSFIPALDYFGGTTAHELYSRPAQIAKNGESIYISGVPNGSFGLSKEELAFVPDAAFSVFAYHEPYPDILPAKCNVDLLLTGHTHGGQVVLPLIGALITRSKYGLQYVSGMYQLGAMQMYVNRGIGMEGHGPRVRFLCPPEIAVFDIVPAAK